MVQGEFIMHKPIKVLHVLGRLNYGGIETLIINIFKRIDRTKVQFDFVVHTDDKGNLEDEVIRLGGKIFRVSRYRGTNHYRYINEWKILFENNSYDIVHCHIRSTAMFVLQIAKQFGIVTIAHSHNTSSGKGILGTVKRLYQLPVRYIADYFFACSLSAGIWEFGKKVCNGNKFYVLKNAIDLDKFTYNEETRNEIRKTYNLDNKFVIGNVGRLVPQKNQIRLLSIFKEVLKLQKNSFLLIIGSGSLRNDLKRKCKKLEISNNVLFVGASSCVNKYLQSMDVFLFPSLYEGLGIVTIEAQANGLPCIVSDAIPSEAFVTDMIEAVPLSKNDEFWAKKILSYKRDYSKISNMYATISKQGYDIAVTTKWIQNFYLEIEREKK